MFGGAFAQSFAKVFNGIVSIVYLLRDEFLTSQSPVSSPRASEPGPGTFTIVDTGNVTSIAYDHFTMPRTTSYDPSILSDSFAAGAGTAVIFQIIITGASVNVGVIGFMSATNFGGIKDSRIVFLSGASIYPDGGSAYIGRVSQNIAYTIAIVCRSVGGFVLASGGHYGDGYKLLWVGNTIATDSTEKFGSFAYGTGTMNFDFIHAGQLQSPWITDYGIATSHSASAIAGETASMETEAIIEATWQAVAGEVYELSFLRIDDDNRWIIRCSQAGSTIKLIERAAGVETERGSAAQTFSAGTNYRIIAITYIDPVYGRVVSTYVGNVWKVFLSFATASSATGAKTSHAVTHFTCWPVSISGAALSALGLYDPYLTKTITPFTSYSDNAYTDVLSRSDSGTYICTSPLARTIYTTTATKMVVDTYNDIYSIWSELCDIGIRVNGADFAVLSPTVQGSQSKTVELGIGNKTVEIISGFQGGPPSTGRIGVYACGVWFNGPATYVSDVSSPRLTIYGDSIAAGAMATNPSLVSWAQLVRNAYSGSLLVEAWSSRCIFTDAGTPEALAATVAQLTAPAPSIVWFAIGVNDWNRWADFDDFADAYAGIMDGIHAALPSAIVYAQSPTITTIRESTLPTIRTKISDVQSSRSAWSVFVDGTAILSTGDLTDGLHPSTAGHAKYALAVKTILGI